MKKLRNVKVVISSWFPYLHNVILADRANDPRVIRVPAEVGNLGGVTTVDEQEFGRSVLGVFRGLLLSDFRQIPNVETPVGPGGGQDRLVMGRPLYLG